MVQKLSRRGFLGSAMGALAGSGWAAGAWAGAPAVSLRPQMRPEALGQRAAVATDVAPDAAGSDALIREAGLGGEVAYALVAMPSGRVLEGREAKRTLPPASVTKAVTAIYALETLGANYRFETRLVGTGAVRNGVLQGDLILAGGGDPTLDTDGLALLAAKLKKAGINEVRGRFYVWGGALKGVREIDKTQPVHAGYNPAVSGLNLNYNRVHFEWKRSGGSYVVAMDARSKKYRPNVRLSRMTIAQRKSPVYVYKDAGDYDSWTVASGALGNGGSRWLPMRKPELYAGEVFATFARAQGIVLKPAKVMTSRPGGNVLASVRSPALKAILAAMLKYSTNLTAELVGMTASTKRMGKPASLRASADAMSAWARQALGMQNAKLVDHSGLGEDSRLTATAMAQALAKVPDVLRPILKDIPMRNTEGKIIKSHPVKVVAKTGTLYFVSSLAGYIRTPAGTDLAFAIFSGDTEKRRKIDRSQDGRPSGSRGWNKRAKGLQQKLIQRWGKRYT